MSLEVKAQEISGKKVLINIGKYLTRNAFEAFTLGVFTAAFTEKANLGYATAIGYSIGRFFFDVMDEVYFDEGRIHEATRDLRN